MYQAFSPKKTTHFLPVFGDVHFINYHYIQGDNRVLSVLRIRESRTMKIQRTRDLVAMMIVLSASFTIPSPTANAQDATLTILSDPLLYGVTAAWDVTPDGSMVVGVSDGRVFRFTAAGGGGDHEPLELPVHGPFGRFE